MWEVGDLGRAILDTPNIEGVTFTGGEPFEQARALAEVARRVREMDLSIFIFTGLQLNELNSPAQQRLLKLSDVVVDGRYVEAERRSGLTWRGSANQRVHFLTDRYGWADMLVTPEVEFHLGADGSIVVTGFPVDLAALDLVEFSPSGLPIGSTMPRAFSARENEPPRARQK